MSRYYVSCEFCGKDFDLNQSGKDFGKIKICGDCLGFIRDGDEYE